MIKLNGKLSMLGRCFSLLLMLGLSGLVLGASTPKERVEGSIGNVIKLLKEKAPDGAEAQLKDNLKKELAGLFSYHEMVRRTVNKKDWKALSADEQQEFAGLFQDLLERTYIEKLTNFTDQKIVFGKEKINKKKTKAKVATKIVTLKAEIPIDYRLIDLDGAWWVYDVKIEGLSLIGNYRSQFTPLLAKEKFSGLKKRIAARLKELDKAAKKG